LLRPQVHPRLITESEADKRAATRWKRVGAFGSEGQDLHSPPYGPDTGEINLVRARAAAIHFACVVAQVCYDESMRNVMRIKIPKDCKGECRKELRAKTQEYVDKILAYDVDWDYCSLLEMMRLKLLKMSKCFKRCGSHTNSKKYAATMKNVADAIKRLNDDEYFILRSERLKRKYGVKAIIARKKDSLSYSVFKLVPRRKGVKFGEKEQKAYDKEWRQALQDAMKEQKADLALVFGTMKKEVLCWWD